MEIYKRIKKHTVLFVLFLSAVSFTLLYIRLGNWGTSSGTTELDYVSYFLQYVFDSFTPLFVAIAILSGRDLVSWKSRLLSALLLSLPRLVYLVPHYYLEYIGLGYDSLESLMLLSLKSIFMLLIFVIETVIYYFVADFFIKKSKDKWDFFAASGYFDFSVPVTVSIFSVCFTRFIFNLISEVIDIITYLLDYGEFYSTAEIYYLLAKITLAFASLFLSHVLFMSLRKMWFKLKNNSAVKEKTK